LQPITGPNIKNKFIQFMKKTALLAITLLLSVSYAFAQSEGGASANGDDKNFHFGLNITPGLYFASPGTSGNGNSNAANGAAFGFGYGVNLEFYFSHNYGLATGIEVDQIGVNYTNIYTTKTNNYTDSVITTAHTQTMQYLAIPLVLKLRTNAIGPIKYFGLFGVQPGFLLSGMDNPTVTRDIYSYSYPSGTTDNVNIYHESSFFRVSLIVGLGLEYNLAGSTSIQAAITYDNAFTNVNSNSNNSIIAKGVNLTIGVLF
jgi:hypothetical protein